MLPSLLSDVPITNIPILQCCGLALPFPKISSFPLHFPIQDFSGQRWHLQAICGLKHPLQLNRWSNKPWLGLTDPVSMYKKGKIFESRNWAKVAWSIIFSLFAANLTYLVRQPLVRLTHCCLHLVPRVSARNLSHRARECESIKS